MKRRVSIALLLLVSAGFAADWSSSPQSLVRSFQGDYLAWNNRAMASDSEVGTLKALDLAEIEYAQLLRKYCQPDFKGQPIAFGTDSSHDPQRETILSSEINGSRATVRTEMRRRSGYVPQYEYELLKLTDRWYLLQIYLLDGNEKLPGL